MMSDDGNLDLSKLSSGSAKKLAKLTKDGLIKQIKALMKRNQELREELESVPPGGDVEPEGETSIGSDSTDPRIIASGEKNAFVDFGKLAASIGQFSGGAGSDAVILTPWLQKLQSQADYLKFDPKIALAYVMSNEMFAFIKSCPVDGGTVLSHKWDFIKAWLIKTYDGDYDPLDVRKQLMALKQGAANVQQYGLRFVSVWAKLKLVTMDISWVQQFHITLRDDIQSRLEQLTLGDPSLTDSFDKLLQLAIKIEKQLLVSSKAKAFSSAVSDPSHVNAFHGGHFKSKFAKAHKDEDAPVYDSPPKHCEFCKKDGHVEATCWIKDPSLKAKHYARKGKQPSDSQINSFFDRASSQYFQPSSINQLNKEHHA